MSARTPEEEVKAFKVQVEQLLEKEARCPACAKAKRLLDENTEGETREVGICNNHQRIRFEIAFR